MPEFIVSDRRNGEVIAQGTISSEGVVSLPPLKSSINPDGKLQEKIMATVKEDVADGHSGGQIPDSTYEWFEVFGR
jgi:hypothetical protein